MLRAHGSTPSASPTRGSPHSRAPSSPGQRELARPFAFMSGYLAVWGAAGVGAYGLYALGRHAAGTQLAWPAGGRWLAGSVLAVAALYELTPLKDVCLGKCRSPFGFLMAT